MLRVLTSTPMATGIISNAHQPVSAPIIVADHIQAQAATGSVV